MEITKVVKPFIRRGWPNTFGNIVYIMYINFYFGCDLIVCQHFLKYITLIK